MKKRRLMAWLLCLAMLCTQAAPAVFAEELANPVGAQSTIEKQTEVSDAEPTEDTGLAPGTEASQGPTDDPATQSPATDDPVTEAPTTEAPATEIPATEAPTAETPATEIPVTEAPATDAPTEVPAETEAPTQGPNSDPTGGDGPSIDVDPTQTPGASEDPATASPEATESATPEPEESATPEPEETVTPEPTTVDNESPRISITNAGSHGATTYCEAPHISVTDNVGLEKVTVSVSGISNNFSVDHTLGGATSWSDSPSLKEYGGTITVVAIDLTGNTSSASADATHVPGGRDIRTTEATCTSPGLYTTTMTCKNCQGVIFTTVSQTAPALGHAYASQTFTPCGGSGEITVQICTRCSHVEGDVPIGSGHSFKDYTENKGPCVGTVSYRKCENCGYITDYTESKGPGHRYIHTNKTDSPATCTEAAKLEYKCAVCGDIEVRSSGLPLGHKWDVTYNEGAYPSCTTEGRGAARCERCGIEEPNYVLPAAGHKYKDKILKEADCENDGASARICSVCGDEEPGSRKTIPALGHNYVESSQTEPTCTTPGFIGSGCTRCGKASEGSKEIPAKGHVPGATWYGDLSGHYRKCTVCGQRVDEPVEHSYAPSEDCTVGEVCSLCGYVKPGTRQPSHSWEWTQLDSSGHAAKCINPGCNATVPVAAHKMTNTGDCTNPESCTVCGYQKPGEPAHKTSSTDPWRVDAANNLHYKPCVNPGCRMHALEGVHVAEPDDGSCWTPIRCQVCNTALTARQTHAYGPWVPVNATTHKQTCTNLDGACTMTNTARHDLKTKVQTESEATCVTEGKTLIITYCEICGYESEEETISPATGHDFGPWEDVTSSSCAGAGTRKRVCDKCGLSETDTLNPNGHAWEDHYTVDSPATCTSDGSQSIHCANCEATMDPQVIQALDHSFGPGEQVSEATCLVDRMEKSTCTRCGESLTHPVAGTALGHDFAVYTSDGNATCGADGTETSTCTRCGETDTRTAAGSALPHEYVADGDCTTPDLCANCGAALTPSSNHLYDVSAPWLVDAASGEHYKLCTNEGCLQRAISEPHNPEPNDGDCTTPIHCVTCGEIVALGNPAHNLGNWVLDDIHNHRRACQNEMCTYTETAPHEVTKVDEVEISAPSCTTGGEWEEMHYCLICSSLIETVRRTSEPLGHSFGDWEILSSPDCDDSGTRQRTCNACGLVETQIDNPDGHAWEDHYTVDQAPTCTSDGSESIHCSRCSATKDAREIEELGHDMERIELVTAATCTSDAIEEVRCKRCAATLVQPVSGSALGHDFQNYVSDGNATCGANGTETGFCTRCDAIDTRVVEGSTLSHVFDSDFDCTTAERCLVCGARGPANARHSYDAESPWLIDAATGTHYKQCTNDGCSVIAFSEPHIAETDDDDCTTPLKCAVCGAVMAPGNLSHNMGAWVHTDAATHTRYCQNPACSYSESEAHTATAVREQIVSAPSCTTEGSILKISYCPVCEGILSQELTTTPAAGHRFGEWYPIESTGCSDPDDRQRSCAVCGYTETEIGNLDGHLWEDHYTVDQAPTCILDGSQSIHCARCAATRDPMVLEELGHEFVRGETMSAATCTENAVVREVCSRCGDEVAHAVPGTALGHNFETYTSDGNATCGVDDTETAMCSRCDALDTRTQPGSALSHVPNSAIPPVAHAATCTQSGYITFACELCGQSYRTSVLPALGHKPVSEGDRAATCTEAGYKGGTHCSVCGAALTAGSAIPALGHAFGGWSANGGGTHSASCSRCGSAKTESCSYSDVQVGAALVHVCKVCGDVVSLAGEGVATHRFEVVADARIELVDADAMPAGELVVRKLDEPFGGEMSAYEAFTVACELDGEALPLNGRIRVTIPVACEPPFELFRVDPVENPETGELTEEWVEMEFSYNDGRITFETDSDGLFLLTPLDAAEV